MIKLKSVFCFLIVCFSLSQWTYAQNEPFKGGIGRGDFVFSSNLTYVSGEDPGNVCHGGIGRGDIKNLSAKIFFNGVSANILYPGGNGRGDIKSNSSLLFFNGVSANLLYPGGIGRGDIKSNSSLLFFSGVSANILYPGGNGRGDILSRSKLFYFNGDLVNSLFQGGIGRGDVTALRSLSSLPGGSVFLTLNLFIEGYYLGGGLMQAAVDPVNSPTICDTVTVELHDAVTPYNFAFSFSQLINTSGTGIYTLLPAIKNHSYYIVLKHRNALETWSALPVSFNNNLMNYSFTNLITKAYGNNMRDLGDGNFAIWSGDISDAGIGPGFQDGIIESQDYSDMENAINLILTGYVVEDLTGDGVVESSDYSNMENNVGSIIFSMHP